MSSVFSFLDTIIFALLSPFSAMPWGISIVLTSLIFSVVFVFAYRLVSSQDRIRAARNSIRTSLLEAVVFRRDARVCIRAQGSLFMGGLRYLGWAIVPVTLLMIPGTILISRTYLAIGVEPFRSGVTFLVHGQVSNPATLSSLEISSNQALTVGPMVRSLKDGAFVARVSVNSQTVASDAILTAKTSASSSAGLPVLISGSTTKPQEISSKVSWGSILLPAGQFLLSKDGPVNAMWIEYPERTASFGGHQISWLVLFVILTLAWGIGVAKIFGIAL